MKHLKLSTDGPNGSGKTCTMAQLAAGIAKEYCGSGPVHVYDSSDRWGAWKMHIFDKEKVPLVLTVGTSLAALKQSMDDIEFRAKLGQAKRAASTSRELIVSGKTEWAKDKTARTGYLEELSNLLDHCFPGGEKRSKLDAMYRNLTLEFLNGFSSWSRQEDASEVSTINLKRNVEIVKALRARMGAGEKPTDQASLAALLHLASDDVLNPGHGVTLHELMAAKSVEAAKPKGPQPVVNAMDNEPADLAG